MTASFERMCSVSSYTRRQGAVSYGLAGDMATNIAALDCTPIDPVTPELAQTAGLEAWVGLYQTMVEGGLDIARGDQFVAGGVVYKVRAVADYEWGPDVTTLVILEKLA
jgi:hypothetical protein